MKKVLYFLCSIALLQSCEKEVADPTNIDDAKKVTIGVAYEPVLDADTRVAIEENGDKFSLIWEGTDNIEMATSTNNVYNSFTLSSYNGTSAVFMGTLPEAGTDITTTDYFAATSSFVSRSKTADRNTLRLAIATNQEAAGTSIANSCMLAGKLANCPVGTIDGTFALKTMNAFLKIPVTKGAAASGSSNTYTNGMFLENVKIESIGGEQLAGRFAIDVTADDWTTAYAADAGIKEENKSSSVTLNCNNLPLGDEPQYLYVAVAFGTYSSGLKVTFTVTGDGGTVGVQEKTIGSAAGITLARNTMLSMPSVSVTPTDVAVDHYRYIKNATELQAGTYYMAAKIDAGYAFAKGTISSGDLATTDARTYNEGNETIDLTDAAEIVLEAKDATAGEYYIKIGGKYLSSSAKSNRKLVLNDVISGEPPYWTIYDDAKRGGLAMRCSAFEVYLVTAGSASSNYLRSYTGPTSGTDGVYLFYKVK